MPLGLAVGTAPSSSDTVAYWAMEDLTDETGTYSLNEHIGKEPTLVTTGILDDCYDYSGSDEYLNFSRAVTDSDAISISFWFNADSISASDQLLGIWHQAEQQYLIRLDDSLDHVEAYVIGTGGTVGPEVTTTTVSTGTWYHYVLTYDSTNGLNVYLNDGTVSNAAADGTLSRTITRTDSFIGVYYAAPDKNFFDGRIDELTVFDVALTADNVEYLYNGGTPTSAQQYPFTSGWSIKVNIGDSWKAVTAIKQNIGDTWKTVSAVKQNIGDSWKDV